MTEFRRYAVYAVPQPSPFYKLGSAWLGWDTRAAQEMPHPDLKGLPASLEKITRKPRKYGLHGTLRAPFYLPDSINPMEMKAALAERCKTLKPAQVDGLELSALGSFLALTPQGDTSDLARLALETVLALETFRAPLTEEDRARRSPDQLTPSQRGNLDTYGYPYIGADFAFHITLTGRIAATPRARVQAIAMAHFAHALPSPFKIEALTLCGERPETGRFEVIQDYPLEG
ncbi:MAG: DUF1045 domain-containing protein [Pseudomonadota bacterium]